MTIRTVSLAAIALALAQTAGTAWGSPPAGTITGRVQATPAKYLAETVIYLRTAPAGSAARKFQMDQRKLKFDPHVLAISVGDTVEFTNHDTVMHEVHCMDGAPYFLGVVNGNQSLQHKFEHAGVYGQLCAIHPEMLAMVFVGENPYESVVESDGRFTIHDVPPGTYTVAAWNSQLKAADQSVTVAEGAPSTLDFTLAR